MKKIILVLLTVLLFGCDQINDLISYFVDIEYSGTSGTTETVFEFSVDTNDSVIGWYVDDVPMSSNARSATGLTQKFSAGDHVISVVTENGAEDSINIFVTDIETIFKISGYQRIETTLLELNYPMLTYDGVEYNIESDTGPYSVQITETQRIITMGIEVDVYAFFYFMSNNMLAVEGIDSQNMSIEEFNQMLTFIYPPPEPPIPEYSITKFNLSGYQRVSTDLLYVFSDHISINGEDTLFDDLTATYDNDVRTVSIGLEVDVDDFFIFMQGCSVNFFGFDLDNMTYEQFVIISDVIRRFPEETIFDLSDRYKP